MSRADFRSDRHCALESEYPSQRYQRQFYAPGKARPVNLWRRILRAVIGAL